VLDGTLHPSHLAVEVGAARPDVGVSDAVGPKPVADLLTELAAVVGLNTAQGEEGRPLGAGAAPPAQPA
jgi:hypothetical protein